MKSMSRLGVALVATAALAGLARAEDVRVGSIVISDGWSRPTATGMAVGVAYFRVRNDGAADDAIVSASTPAAARVEMHQTTLADGMARMRPLKAIAVPAKATVAVAPGGIHLMLVDLATPLTAGTRLPLVLQFRNAGRIEIRLAVEARAE